MDALAFKGLERPMNGTNSLTNLNRSLMLLRAN